MNVPELSDFSTILTNVLMDIVKASLILEVRKPRLDMKFNN